MTDREPLEAMQRIWGGTFNGPYDREPPKKPVYWYTLQGLVAVREFFEAVQGYLSPRRIESIKKNARARERKGQLNG